MSRVIIEPERDEMSRLMNFVTECHHQRKIEMKTYPVDDSHILCRGIFTEERLRPYYKLTGERVEAGPLHNLEILLLVKTPELIIEDIEVLTGSLPREDCYKISNTLDCVKGLAIKGGFSAKVRELAGGSKGCTHLTHLLCTMAPAVLQGYWAISYQRRSSQGSALNKERALKMAERLKDSCYSWREEGAAYQKLKSLLSKE